MILPNNVAILRNIKDSFYYNGIEISKENFDINELEFINGYKEYILTDEQLKQSLIEK